tara:strand:+ start:3764 stop:3940 length:177 start_codon:yes stop_codon:yes gene_type:complete
MKKTAFVILKDKIDSADVRMTKFKSKIYSYNFELRIKIQTLEDKIEKLQNKLNEKRSK